MQYDKWKSSVAGACLLGLMSGASVYANELNILADLDLSGPTADIGKEIEQGIKLAEEQFNANGGLVIDGTKYKVNVIYNDNKGDAAKSGQKTLQEIMKHKVVAVLPSFDEDKSIQAARVSQSLKTPLIATWTAASEVIAGRSFAFKVLGDYKAEANAMKKFAKEKFNASKIAVIYNEKDTYSLEAAKAIKDSFEEEYGEDAVISFISFSSQSEIEAKIGELSNDAEFLYVPLDQYETPMVVSSVRRNGWKKPIAGTSYWVGGNLAKCGKDCANSYITGFFAAKGVKGAMSKFVADYKAKYNSTPSEPAASGYDAFNVVANGLRKLSSIDTAKVQAVRNDLQKAIASMEYEGATGRTKYSGESGEPKKCVVVSQINSAGELTFAENVCL